MSIGLAVPLFLVSAAVTFAAAGFFADKLDVIGPRLGLPEVAVGLLTAFAADTPEISSALVALVSGHQSTSLGVVLGSNAFNLAAMIGGSAVAAGLVTIGRPALALEGAVGVLALLAAAALVTSLLSATVAFVLLVAILAGYLLLTLRRHHEPHPSHAHLHERESRILVPLALIAPAVILIVLGSIGMVHAALAIGDDWHVPQMITGVLVLAVLTSLPNAFTAVRLGLAGRGEALISETFASNTINLIGGLLVPALFVSVSRRTTSGEVDLAWLFGMTVLTLAALASPRGLGRTVGALLVALYVAFAAIQIAIG
jgi:cation:H+ antiporter